MQILQSGQFKVWFSLKEWLEIICIEHFLLLFVENMEQISSHSYGSPFSVFVVIFMSYLTF